jgi:tetratricopeptide (TPR) repeat protein
MTLFDKFKHYRSNPSRDWFRREIKKIYREEEIPYDESSLDKFKGEIPRIRMFMCRTNCGSPMVIHIGNSSPAPCSVCGRNLEEIEVDLSQIALEGKERDAVAAKGHYEYAGRCFKKDDPMAALKSLNRAIELDPKFVDAYYNRAEARIALGDLDGAIEDCNNVIRMTPDAADAFVKRGAAKAMKQDYQGCVDDTTKALSLGYTKPIALFNRGMSFVYLSKVREAIQDLRKFVELAPSDPRAVAARKALILMGDR